MEIRIPWAEWETEKPQVGEFGEITLKVEVMSVDQEGVCLQKHDKVKVTKDFNPIDLEEMRNRIGIVKDAEKSINESEKSDDEESDD